MKRTIAAAAMSAAILFAGALLAPAATAAEAVTPDPQIADMLDAVPGGELVDAYHAVWPDEGMEMTVTPPEYGTVAARAVSIAASVGLCPSNKICAFSLTATKGARLSWSTCTAHPVGTFTVRSIANARSSGYIQSRYGTTVRATAYAGNWANSYGSVSRIVCY